ncbi:hypothetical protein [Variovorax saccharolyticus]|uniref:hypothetical protein n=1 Tax=Variovorax saccharolyticus TaxID=3053516 RepID=UPI00257715EB|nr:hypothetical protein [Variovorax sp. J31P216]MDM0030081.1 hypothetical protein [Variovorax sp. J31P216]
MKRDWDLLREQLLAIEQDKDFKTAILGGIPDEPKWAHGQTEASYLAAMSKYRAIEERVFGHLEMLVDNGYIDGVMLRRGAGSNSLSYGLASPRLTMAGTICSIPCDPSPSGTRSSQRPRPRASN